MAQADVPFAAGRPSDAWSADDLPPARPFPTPPPPNFRPRRDAKSPSGYYVPATLDEAAEELLRSVSTEYLDYFRSSPPEWREPDWGASGIEQIEGNQVFEKVARISWIQRAWMFEGSRLVAHFRARGVRSRTQMRVIVDDRTYAALFGETFDMDRALRRTAWATRFE